MAGQQAHRDPQPEEAVSRRQFDDQGREQDQQRAPTGSHAVEQGGRRQMADFLAVQEALRGVEYPASRERLLRCARSNGASADVLWTLDELPDQNFGSPADVSEAMGRQR